MANLILLDAHGRRVAIEASGAGTDDDPFVFDFGGGAGAGGSVAVSSIAAGENHIGHVTGFGAVITPSFSVSTTPAYSAGDTLGGKMTLANAVRISGGVSLLQSIMIADRANQKPIGTIFIYNADPTAATLTDNATLVNSTDDFKILAQIPVITSDYVTVNNKAYATLRNVGAMVKAAAGTTLYASFCVVNTPTFASTSDLQMMFDFLYAN